MLRSSFLACEAEGHHSALWQLLHGILDSDAVPFAADVAAEQQIWMAAARSRLRSLLEFADFARLLALHGLRRRLLVLLHHLLLRELKLLLLLLLLLELLELMLLLLLQLHLLELRLHLMEGEIAGEIAAWLHRWRCRVSCCCSRGCCS